MGDSCEERMDSELKGTLCFLTRIDSFLCCVFKEGHWKRMWGMSQIELGKKRVQRGETLTDILRFIGVFVQFNVINICGDRFDVSKSI